MVRNEALRAIGGSALTDDAIAVPTAARIGHDVPVTYVPFRNAHFLSVAVSWAEVLGAEKVYIGAVEPDSSGYPDCRPAYYEAFNEVVEDGHEGGRIEIVTPLIAMRKAEIVRLGLELGAPFDLTWSCYSREDRACGVCDSCVLRLRAFEAAGVQDPIPYACGIDRICCGTGVSELSIRLSGIGEQNIEFAGRQNEKVFRNSFIRNTGAGTVLFPSLRPGVGNGKRSMQGRSGQPDRRRNRGLDQHGQRPEIHPQDQQEGRVFFVGTHARQVHGDSVQERGRSESEQRNIHVKGFQVQLDENTLDFDLKKEQENAAKGQGLDSGAVESRCRKQQAKEAKETNTVKALNEKLNAAKTAADAGDYDTAIAALNEATQMDATRDLIWFKLGDDYRLSAPKQTDPAEKQKRLDSAVEAYQKAVEIKKGATNDKDPNAAKNLAAYYNNLAEAYAKAKKIDDAVKTYELAAQADPTQRRSTYFNIGAVLTNAGKVDDAIAAFEKCIAADPNRADAYYWKGVNLIGKATLQGDKMIAPPGTAEAFQKYLELHPRAPMPRAPSRCWPASVRRWKRATVQEEDPPPKK